MILFHHSDRKISRILEDEHEHDFLTSGKKAKFARSHESLPTGLLCNQYNPECDGKFAIRIS